MQGDESREAELSAALTRAYTQQDPADRAEAEARVSVEWSVGDVILDLYEVKGILGEGGMGRVYRVHHRGWDVDLAVKSPLPEALAATEGKADFVREAEAWSELGLHPHIVSCYYVRTLGDIPRVFAECVEGGSLEDWIGSRRLYDGGPETALERILDVAIQFAWGLDYAHEQGLVHQDVKPLNVMMTPDGTPKVTDFGLAKAARRSRVESTESGGTLLVTSGLMTPAYASPEQAAGGTLSRRTDLWSWALSVLQMFQGERTWQFGQTAPDVLKEHLAAPPEDPALPPMPGAVAKLLGECFRKSPDGRPRTMLDVASELREVYSDVRGGTYARSEPEAAPDTAESLNNRGCSLYDLGKGTEAQAVWVEALRYQPDQPQATYNLGLVRWRSGHADDTVLLRDLRRGDRDDWRWSYAQALVHLERADPYGALGALRHVPAADRSRPEVLRVLDTAKTRPSAAGRMVRAFEGHTDIARSARLSRDGRHALSGSDDRTLKLWEVTSGRCLRTLEGNRRVFSVRLSEDGRIAVSGSGDPGGHHQTFKLWDVAKGACLRTFEGPKHRVNSVDLSADGRIALTAGSSFGDATIQLWDVQSGRCLRSLATRSEPNSARLSPDCQRALSAGLGTTLKLWDMTTGRCVRTFRGHTDAVTSADFSADGRHALSGSDDKTLKLWELATGRCVRTLVGHADAVNSVHVIAGDYALSGSDDNTVKLWNLATGRCLRTFEGHEAAVTSVHASADGCHALSGSSDTTLKLWALEPCYSTLLSPLFVSRALRSEDALRARRTYEAEVQSARSELASGNAVAAAQHVRRARSCVGHRFGKEAMDLWATLHGLLQRGELQHVVAIRTFEGHSDAVTSVHLNPDCSRAVSGSDDNTLRVWDVSTGRCLHTLDGNGNRSTPADLSADGNHVLCANGRTLKLWELSTGRCLKTLDAGSVVTSVSLSADANYAVSATREGTLRLWALGTGNCVQTVTTRGNWLTAIDLSGDALHALCAFGDKRLALWELRTGRRLRTFKGHALYVHDARLSRDGSYALSGSMDRTLRLWDVGTGRCLSALEGHMGDVTSIALSADGRHALSGGADATLKLWDVVTSRCVWTVDGHGDCVTSVQLSADGRHALSGSADKTMRLWYLDWELGEGEPAALPFPQSRRSLLDRFLSLFGT